MQTVAQLGGILLMGSAYTCSTQNTAGVMFLPPRTTRNMINELEEVINEPMSCLWFEACRIFGCDKNNTVNIPNRPHGFNEGLAAQRSR